MRFDENGYEVETEFDNEFVLNEARRNYARWLRAHTTEMELDALDNVAEVNAFIKTAEARHRKVRAATGNKYVSQENWERSQDLRRWAGVPNRRSGSRRT